jgi:hypothetical protein
MWLDNVSKGSLTMALLAPTIVLASLLGLDQEQWVLLTLTLLVVVVAIRSLPHREEFGRGEEADNSISNCNHGSIRTSDLGT